MRELIIASLSHLYRCAKIGFNAWASLTLLIYFRFQGLYFIIPNFQVFVILLVHCLNKFELVITAGGKLPWWSFSLFVEMVLRSKIRIANVSGKVPSILPLAHRSLYLNGLLKPSARPLFQSSFFQQREVVSSGSRVWFPHWSQGLLLR